MRTVPDISNDLKPLAHVIGHKFIKSILYGYECSDTGTKLFTLLVKHGGMSVYNPTERYQIENSRLVTHLMVERLNNHDKIHDKSIEKSQLKHHAEIKKQKSRRNCEKLEEIKSFINEKITRALEASIEASTLSWLTTLPIKKYGFSLDKQSFWDSSHSDIIFH